MREHTSFLFDLLEGILVAFMISGVLWNVLAGYSVVQEQFVVGNVVLTTVLFGAVLAHDRTSDIVLLAR
jgi:ABC-type uncharacterized transport system fused permease/ATPase subunit